MSRMEHGELQRYWSGLHTDPCMNVAFGSFKEFCRFALKKGYRLGLGLRLVHTDSSRKYSDRYCLQGLGQTI